MNTNNTHFSPSFTHLLICMTHFLRFCSHLSLSTTSPPLYQGKASHSLLQRRSAPRKVVRLLPDKRGQLSYMSHFGIFSRIKCIFPQKRATVLNTMTLFSIFVWPFFIFPLVSGEVPAASSLPASVHLFLCLCLSFPGFLYFALPVFVPSRRGKVSCIHCRFPV